MPFFFGAISLILVIPVFASAEDIAAKVAAQKKGAQENWSSLELGEAAHLETAHLFIFAPKTLEKRLKEAGVLFEKVHDQARAALKYQDKDDPWSGVGGLPFHGPRFVHQVRTPH